MNMSRRQALVQWVGASAWAVCPAWAQTERHQDGRLVFVFLRGAYDGLSMLVPYADPHYQALRPQIAIPAPDGSRRSALELDGRFGLHPACADLLPLWQEGLLAAIVCAGSPDPTRSHFDAQYHWETGQPGRSSAADGWMNLACGSTARPTLAAAIGVGEPNPRILLGPQRVQLVASGASALRAGTLANAQTRQAMQALYASNAQLTEALSRGADSRLQTAQMLSSPDMAAQEQSLANNGAGAAQGLALDAQRLGTLMNKNRALRCGFLSSGGWDTHINQGDVTGVLANNLGHLSRTLLALRQSFNGPRDVVVVASEFGRTCAENGSRGTDHGHGNIMWVMGTEVQGGRCHGRWQGLASAVLNQNRDLPVHHDFRAVLAQALVKSQGMTPAQVAAVFPGYSWDSDMDGLFRA
jgi:uncharacterized protein (DUF1501 family)